MKYTAIKMTLNGYMDILLHLLLNISKVIHQFSVDQPCIKIEQIMITIHKYGMLILFTVVSRKLGYVSTFHTDASIKPETYTHTFFRFCEKWTQIFNYMFYILLSYSDFH